MYRTSSYVEPVNVNTFARKVYLWMTGLLALTAFTSFASIELHWVKYFKTHYNLFLGMLAIELALIIGFSYLKEHIKFNGILLLTLLYTGMSGVTLSVVLSLYNPMNVFFALIITTGIFVIASFIGYFTKYPVTQFKMWFILALFGLIIGMFVNLLLHSSIMNYVISGAAVLVFTGLAAYDAKKIKELAESDPSPMNALSCAVDIYLDVVNLFLHILKLSPTDKGLK